MEKSMQEGMLTMASYLKSLKKINPAWEEIEGQEKLQHSNTFCDLLGNEYSSTKDLEIQRSNNNNEQPLFHEMSDPMTQGPIRIEFSTTCGRYEVASKDIPAGDVILRENCLVLAPQAGVGPTCLHCLKFLGDTWEGCENCGAPVCSPRCHGIDHSPEECKVIGLLDLKNSSDVSLIKLLNTLLTPLRTLLLLRGNPFAGQVLDALQCNKEIRKKLPVGRFIDQQIVKTLRSRMGLKVDPEVIHQICGVFDTNAFEVILGDNRRGRAIFPLAAIMNHTCLPNTQRWYKDGELIVRAITDIKAGEPLTNTYTPMLLGTRERAAQLAATKLFKCSCMRCMDPTELGSHISSLKCRNCKSVNGLMVPSGDPNKDWQCQECGNSLSNMAVDTMLRAASSAISRIPLDDLESLSTMLDHLSKILGDRHFITTEVRYAYVNAIMRQPQQDISDDDLKKVVKMTDDLLHTVSIINPGLSRFRGNLLLEKLRACTEILTREETKQNKAASSIDEDEKAGQEDSNNNNEKDTILERAKMLLDEATECEFILLYDLKLADALEVTNRLKTFLIS